MTILKNLLLIILFAFYSPVFSQQFEWQKTIESSGKLTKLGIPNDIQKIKKYSLFNGDRMIVSYLALSESIDVDPGTGVNLLKTSGNFSDAAFSIFDVNGIVLNSQIINTPNETDGALSFCYDKKNKFIYALFYTRSDSVRFTPTGSWHKINKVNNFATESFLLKYDSIGNFIQYYDFSNFGGSLAYEIDADTSGNIYISGNSSDSLIYRNNYYPRNSSNIKGKNQSFLMKLNSNAQVVWVTFSNSFTSNFKISHEYNKMYLITSVPKDSSMNFKYNSNGTYNTASSSEYRNILYEVNLSNGEIGNSKILTKSNSTVGVKSIRLSKSNLLILTNNTNSNSVNLTFDSETKVSRGGIWGSNHLSCFSLPNYVYQFTNIFDSTQQFNISEIYDDTSYSITGSSNGNRLLSFKGQKIYTSDYLGNQPLLYSMKPFFASYSTNNYLKNLWYYNPQTIQTSISLTDIISINKDIFMVGNVNLSTNLALGNRTNTFSSSNFSTTLIKYNCKPTAYFNFKSNGKKVDFKNLSLSATKYLWEYGIGNGDYDTIKHPTYFFPTIGGTYTPQLVASNGCGKDTFSLPVMITASNIKTINENVINIYPNPTNNKFKVSLNNPNQYDLVVYDIQGRNIFQARIFDNAIIETNNWSNGIYQIHLSNSEGTYMCKLIVCH